MIAEKEFRDLAKYSS